MNAKCALGQHDYRKVYLDQELIDEKIFKQDIEEIWVCTRCGKAKEVMGTVGGIE